MQELENVLGVKVPVLRDELAPSIWFHMLTHMYGVSHPSFAVGSPVCDEVEHLFGIESEVDDA